MFSLESLLRCWHHETEICIALAAKMPPGGLEYRPTPGQRNTLELMRYLSKGPYTGVIRTLAGDWTATKPSMELAKDMPPSDFAAQMRWQEDEVTRALRAANPEDLVNGTMTFPWGETYTKIDAIVNYPYRWLTGYRMQLFLYLKAAGANGIATPDLWRPPKAS
jgi:hypothetical protein